MPELDVLEPDGLELGVDVAAGAAGADGADAPLSVLEGALVSAAGEDSLLEELPSPPLLGA